jgi:YD repeat-containing protein
MNLLNRPLNVLASAMLIWIAFAWQANAQAVTFVYDQLGRISTATYPNGAVITYGYDAAGNRTQVVTTAGAANNPPSAVNDAVSTAFNTPLTFDPRTNDTDPEGGVLAVHAVTQPGTGGSVTFNGTSITFTPTAGYSGTTTFSYTIRDPQNAVSPPATVTVTVTAAANQPPVAVNDSTSTNSNTPLSLDPRTNDSDPEGGALTIISVTAPSSGSAVVTGGGTGVTYTPAVNFIGAATFTYTVRDPQNATATATVTATVNNQGPNAANDAASTNSNTAVSLDPRLNDSDPEGGALTIVSVTTPSSGSAVVVGGGTGVTFTPAANFIGIATFAYTVRDPQNATATATVTVTVNNQGPTAQPDSTNTPHNTGVTFDPRMNDSDPEGGALTVHAVTQPASGGSVTFNGTSITFTPTTGYSGPATFSYSVRDPQNAVSGPATVTVTVAPPPNVPPVAVNDSAETTAFFNEVTYIDVNWSANDSDANGDPLTVISVTQPANANQGSVAIQGNTILYTSGLNNVLASFNYTISDGQGGQATANVQVQITRESPN